MLKVIIYLILIIILVIGSITAFHLSRVALRNQREMKPFEGPEIALKKDFKKVLIIYYSLTGHTKEIAEKIQKKTGGELYEIKTLEPIQKSPWFYLNLRSDLKNKKYPELAGEFPNLQEYDLVFIGSPVWWYTVSTPVLSFLNKADLNGVQIVPFSTQGSNTGTFLEDFVKNAQNASILRYESFNNLSPKYDGAVNNKIINWLNGL